MEELAQYDPNVVVGILGGSAGTTCDAFKLIHDAQKYGARVALFGRKINNAEHQLAFIEMLRLITDGRVTPEEAVHAYHSVLQSKGIRPHRPLEDDLKLTDPAMHYGGGATPRATVEVQSNALTGSRSEAAALSTKESAARMVAAMDGYWPKFPNGKPDFEKMTPQQRSAYHAARLRRALG